MFVSELGRDLVFARGCREVRHVDGTVLVVLAVDVGFAGSFYSECETSCSCSPRGDNKVCRIATDSVGQPWAIGVNFVVIKRTRIKLVGGSLYMIIVILNVYRV